MKTYILNAVIGQDKDGNPILKEFVIKADNFAEARHKLTELISSI